MIFQSTRDLMGRYRELEPGDVVIGPIAKPHLGWPVLVDLLERGIRCYPSALSQVLYRSKTAQAFFLGQWMLPLTCVISRRADLIQTMNEYGREGIGEVVTKQERLHCGHGVRKWDSVEMLYSHVGLDETAYPFVMQPFLDNFTDVRVIIVGDYVEAYSRDNPYNFRKNLSVGGSCRPFEMDSENESFCRAIMDRGHFPYAHVDLHLTVGGDRFLSEISLNGGLKGARIDRKELDQRKEELLHSLAEQDG